MSDKHFIFFAVSVTKEDIVKKPGLIFYDRLVSATPRLWRVFCVCLKPGLVININLESTSCRPVLHKHGDHCSFLLCMR